MKIDNIHFEKLCGESHYEYLIEFRNLLLSFPDIQALVASPYNLFIALLHKEKQMVNATAVLKNDDTQKIVDANHRMSFNTVKINRTIISLIDDSDSSVAEAAQYLHKRINVFNNTPKNTYHDEIVAVNSLLADLRSNKYAEKVRIAGLTSYLGNLQESETEFVQFLNLCNIEQIQQLNENFKSLRKEIEDVYTQMANIINDDVDNCSKLIKQLNIKIDYFNRLMNNAAKKEPA
ncbi:MAG: DUF6261 family protein [Prevotellaceae bacterium]|jgi:hypothetical protein|nr:DUF6261 family protein [Prevotellaceae bacterium]